MSNKRRKQMITGRAGRVIVQLKNLELKRLISGDYEF